jgi:hypothetical protein
MVGSREINRGLSKRYQNGIRVISTSAPLHHLRLCIPQIIIAALRNLILLLGVCGHLGPCVRYITSCVFLLVVPWEFAYVPAKYLPIFLGFLLLWDTGRLLVLGNDCDRRQWTMQATLQWRDSDRRISGSSFIWSCSIALASPSTDNSQIFHGVTYMAQQVITEAMYCLPIC